MSAAMQTANLWAEIGQKLMSDDMLANPESMKEAISVIAGCFDENHVSFEMLVQPNLKASGTYDEVMAVIGKFWTGFKFEDGKNTAFPGATSTEAIVVTEGAIYACDNEGNEIHGTRKGVGEITHVFTTNEAGKFVAWTQKFDSDHINMCRAKLDSLPTSMPSAPVISERQWFVTHHTFSDPGGPEEFLSDKSVPCVGLANDSGFFCVALMPSHGAMFCIWETTAGTTTSEMVAFVEGKHFPTVTSMKTVCHAIEEDPVAPPYPVSKLKGEKTPFIPKPNDMNSKFYMLQHQHKKIDANKQMMEAFAAMTSEEQKQMLDNAYAAGFAPHAKMHSSTDGMVTFCVWETTMDVKKHEMEAFFDGPLFGPCNGLSKDIAHEIDISEVGAPYPPRFTCMSPKSPKRGGC